MKSIYLTLGILLFTFSSCSTDNDLYTPSTTRANETSKQVQNKEELTGKTQDNSSVTNCIPTIPIYGLSSKISVNVQSRGFYSSVALEGKTVKKNSSGVVPPSESIIDGQKYNTLRYLFSYLNLAQIPNYPAPSTKFAFDGAPGETLEVEYRGLKYVSNTYDANNPPAQLKNIVTFIKSL